MKPGSKVLLSIDGGRPQVAHVSAIEVHSETSATVTFSALPDESGASLPYAALDDLA